MSPNELLATVREQPFVPFRIFMSDGTSHDVRHPEFVTVGTRTTYIFVPNRHRPEFADTPIKVDNLHITKIEPLATVTQ